MSQIPTVPPFSGLRIALLGAAGAMAQVALRDLLESSDAAVTAADLRPVALPPWADPARVRAAAVDVRDEEATARLLAGHHAVLNCVTYSFNLPVMRAALRAGVPYCDLGGLYHGTRRQFELDGDFRAADLPAVLGMGSTPGITNVMAGALAGGFDAVEEIHVRVASVESGGPAPFAPPYALDTVLDEFALEPVVFAAGRAVALPPMSGAEPVDFPTPIGRVEAIHTLHSEIAMFPRSFPGLREASFKVAFAPEFVREMRLLVGLGFAETEPLVGGVAPREMLRALVARLAPPAGAPADCDVLRVEVRGRRGGAPAAARAEAVVLPHPRWRVAAGALDTGVPLSIVGQMLARREIAGAGVLCPETCVPPAPFFAQLARRGIEVIP